MVGIVSWGEFRDNLFYKILVLILLSYARYGCGCRGYEGLLTFCGLVTNHWSELRLLSNLFWPPPHILVRHRHHKTDLPLYSSCLPLSPLFLPPSPYLQSSIVKLRENSLNIYQVNNIWHHGSHSLLDRFYLAFFSKTPKAQKGTIFFSIDNTLLYNPFHHDFGPFHVAHIFRFAKVLHDILGVDSFPSTILICRTKKPMTRLLSFTHIIHQKQGQTQHSSFLHIWYSFNLGRLIWFLRR